MKRHTSWILAFLMIVGLLGFSAISLAEEGKWTRKTDMPTPRSSLSSSVVNGKIYVIGGARFGKSGGGRIGESLSTVEEYDPATDKWTKKADMPTARRSLSTSVINGKIYAIGGIGGRLIGGVNEGSSLSTVEEYDPVSDKWTKKTDMPTARRRLSTSVMSGRIYAIGGRNNEVLSTVEEYDPLD